MGGSAERTRQLVHIAMGGFALLLRWLSWEQALVLAAGAVLFNRYVLPRLGGGTLFRPAEGGGAAVGGIVLYPVAVLLLLVIFRNRLDIAAAAWAILALGDGMATLVGRTAGGRRWPWHESKTVAGSCAFFVSGAAGGSALLWWMAGTVAEPPGWTFIVFAPMAAAAVAAMVETMPVRLDDNLSVPAAAGLTLWAGSLVAPETASGHLPLVGARLPWAVAANAVVAWVGWRAHTVSPAGAWTGAIIGTLIFATSGLAGWTLLLLAFLAAATTTRLGLERKALLGIAEDREGRRGPGNALANCGVATVASLLAAFGPHADAALLAFTAGLTAGASDTVASEVGKAWGRTTLLVPRFVRVPAGTPGAVSLEGTTAGVTSASLLAVAAVVLGLVPWAGVWIVVAAATASAFVESALGAAYEPSGVLDNDLLNAINTGSAAAMALLLYRSTS